MTEGSDAQPRREEVYLEEYDGYLDSEQGTGHSIEAVSDRKRLHAVPGCQPAAEFEQLWAAGHHP